MFITSSYLTKIRTMPSVEYEIIQKTVEAVEEGVGIKELDFYPDVPRIQFRLLCENGLQIEKVNIDESGDEYYLRVPSDGGRKFNITLADLAQAVRIAADAQQYWEAFEAFKVFNNLPEERQCELQYHKLMSELSALENF